MIDRLTLLAALTYASLGGVFVGLGYMLRYRRRVDLLDTPSRREVTDESQLARFVGLWTLLLGAGMLGLGLGIVGGHVRLTDSWAAVIAFATAYVAAVYYANRSHSVPVAGSE